MHNFLHFTLSVNQIFKNKVIGIFCTFISIEIIIVNLTVFSPRGSSTSKAFRQNRYQK